MQGYVLLISLTLLYNSSLKLRSIAASEQSLTEVKDCWSKCFVLPFWCMALVLHEEPMSLCFAQLPFFVSIENLWGLQMQNRSDNFHCKIEWFQWFCFPFPLECQFSFVFSERCDIHLPRWIRLAAKRTWSKKRSTADWKGDSLHSISVISSWMRQLPSI